MESAVLSKIHQAIKDDNLKEFDQLITQKLLCLCLGRFPLLSLCYMYQSVLILGKYEKQLQGITSQNYIQDSEPLAIYPDFKALAGKSLRLFTVGFVNPAEMLALLGLSEKLNYEWKNLEKNSVIIANIRKIYQINFNLECNANEESSNAPRVKGKSHSSNILFTLFIVTICFVFLFSGVLGVTICILGTGNSFAPIKVYSSESFIKNASSCMVLKNDINLSGTYVDKIGTLNGNNKKIIVDDLNIFGTVEGELSDLTIEINLNITLSEIETALIKINNGIIRNVNIVVNGTITENDTENDLLISTLVSTNNGTIQNTKIQGEVSLIGNAKGNASYSAFASTNNGLIVDCELNNGSIKSENVDLAGFVVTNNGNISKVINYQPISQKGLGELEENYAWNPNCTGIAITNYGNIENAQNLGNIDATSDTSKVYQIIVSGIVVNNYGTISNALNTGNISASSLNCSSLVGGIVSFNYAEFNESEKMVKFAYIKESVNKGNISISNSGNENSELVSGGISSFNQGNIQLCDNSGKLSINTKSATVYSAGIVAINAPLSYNGSLVYSTVSECKSETDIEAVIESVGENNINLFGGIVARNQCYLSSCFSFNKFSITAPQREVVKDENNDDNSNENDGEEGNENTVVPTYFVGTVSGLAYVTLNILGGLASTTDNNYGYSENADIKPIGAFAYNNSLINNVNDTLNFAFTDKELMIKTLKEKGLYR